jgi:CHASE1-domain containing sensor protein
LAITTNENREVQEGRFNQGPIMGALIYMPIFRAYNDDGSLRKMKLRVFLPIMPTNQLKTL